MNQYDTDGDIKGKMGRVNPVTSSQASLPALKLKPLGIWQGCSDEAVPFNKEIALRLEDWIVSSLKLPNPLFSIAPVDLQTYFGNECKRFLCALVGYRAAHPNIPISFYTKMIPDEFAAEKLKKIRVAFWSRKWSSSPNVDDGLDEYVPPFTGNDVGVVFNYKYWIRWEEPDPYDYKWALEEVLTPSDEIKERWKESLAGALPPDLHEVKKEEILLSCSSSSSRLPNGKRSKVFKDKSDPKLNYFSHGPLRGHRTPVYKGPTEVRDCVTLPVCQSNTIKWIESQCALLASKMPYSAYGLSSDEFDEKLKDFYEPLSWYYNRDLTKEGLTKPRYILQWIAEVLVEKYPNIEAFQYMDIFKRFDLILEDGTEISTKRGHGLGMANALTTIMQIGNFLFLKNSGLLHEEIDALFYNDDATFKSPNEEGCINLAEEDTEILLSLGLLPKEKKTYTSRLMILCERYFPIEFSHKKSYREYIKRLPFAASCILEAKQMFYMTSDPSLGDPDPHLVDQLISFWGYEWSSVEVNLPWWAGGWLRPKYDGVDLSFLLDLECNQDLARGFAVGPPRLKPPVFKTKREGVWHHPVLNSYPYKDPLLPPEVERTFNINQSFEKIAAKFSRNQDRHSREAFLIGEMARRLNAASHPQKVEDVVFYFKAVIETYPDIDFIPPTTARIEVPVESYMYDKVTPVELPNQPNKLLGALCFWDRKRYIKGVIPYPHWPGDGPYDISPERLDRFSESILSLPGIHKWMWAPERHVRIHGVPVKRYYMNDVRVQQAWQAVSGESSCIIPTYLSPRGVLMYNESADLFNIEKWGVQIGWDFWILGYRTFAIPLMLGIFTSEELDEFEALICDLEPLFEQGPEADKIQHIQPEVEYTNDFWVWRTARNRFSPYPWLEKIFHRVDQAVSDFIIFSSLSNMSESREVNPLISAHVPPEGSGEDLLYKKLINLQAGYYKGFYTYQQPDLTDQWAGDSNSEGEGAFGGLFD